MEEVLRCTTDPGGAGRHQPLSLGEGLNHSQDKGPPLLALATCLQWTRVSPAPHFAVMFAGLACPGPGPLGFLNLGDNMGFAPGTLRASLQVFFHNCSFFSWLFSLPTFSSLHLPPHLCLLPLVKGPATQSLLQPSSA